MAKTKKKTIIPFSKVLDALLDLQAPFPPVHLHRFSELTNENLIQVKNVWARVNPDRRLALLEDLEELAEVDSLVSFNELAKVGLSDTDSRVRATAVRLLWECEDRRLIPTFLNMMVKDNDMVVRASAATALGLFVYKGELEELPGEILTRIEDQLLKVAQGDDQPLVRRRALESLGYSGRDEVPGLLQAAYESAEGEWQASALFGMGRSADVRWERAILDRLDALETEVQLEAIRAAGQLELESARHLLLEKLQDYAELEDEIRMAIVWSLSQIGGKDAREALEKLSETLEDETEADYVDLALENLQIMEDAPGFGLFDLEAVTDMEEHAQIVDLTQPDEDDDDEDLLPDDLSQSDLKR
jgi:HEAT repeat protein